MKESLVDRCLAQGMRMTGQRRIISEVLEKARDHPHIDDLYQRVVAIDQRISLATVYRTVRLLQDAGVVKKYKFAGGPARYETTQRAHHDHLIDLNTGQVIEFVDRDIESLQEKIAHRLGYQLHGHRLELYGVKLPRHKAQAGNTEQHCASQSPKPLEKEKE